MLRNIMIVARRDFIETVKTKAFLIGLIMAPLLFGASFIGLVVMRAKPDIATRRIAIVDHTGKAAQAVIDSVHARNERELNDKVTGAQTMPRYLLETVPADEAHPDTQRLTLSSRIRPGDLYAFIEITADRILLFSNDSSLGTARGWIAGPLEDGIRRARMTQAGIDPSSLDALLAPVSLETMNLVTRDETGRIQAAQKRNPATGVVPIALVMMIFMISATTTGPMLNAIAEDKLQRVHEMLLASATPFELIAGKVLGALARSLLTSFIFIAGALFLLNAMALTGIAPYGLIPWFFVYLIAEITLLCSVASALGAACGSPQEAQSLAMALFAPLLIPMMLMAPIMQKPNGPFATVMSFIPPFTPIIMLLRQATPEGVPAWQPWAGLVGMILGVVAISWGAARVFRIAILLQGKPPAFGQFIRWAIRG